jgi:hypothetical protein
MKLSKLLSLFEDDRDKEPNKDNERSAGEEAKAKGLEDLKFGRYGKNGQVTHIAKDGKLVPYDPAKDEPTKEPYTGPKQNDPEYTRSRVQAMNPADQRARRDQLSRMGQSEFPDTPKVSLSDDDISYFSNLLKRSASIDTAIGSFDRMINDPKSIYHKGDEKAIQNLKNRRQQLIAIKNDPELLKKVQSYSTKPAPEDRSKSIEIDAQKFIDRAGGDLDKALQLVQDRWSHYDKEVIRRSSGSRADKTPHQLEADKGMMQLLHDIAKVIKQKKIDASKQSPTIGLSPQTSPNVKSTYVGDIEEPHPEASVVANVYKNQYGSTEKAEEMLRKTVHSLQNIIKNMHAKGTGKKTQKYQKALEQEKKFLDALKMLLSSSDRPNNPKMADMIPQQSVDHHKENMKGLERLAHTMSRGTQNRNSAEHMMELEQIVDALSGKDSGIKLQYEELVKEFISTAQGGSDPIKDKIFAPKWMHFLEHLKDLENNPDGPYSIEDEPGYDHDPSFDDYKHYGPDN